MSNHDVASMESCGEEMSRAKRRRVAKTSRQEEVIDLVSSSDNSPELVSTSVNVHSTGPSFRSPSGNLSQELNRVATNLDHSFFQATEEASPHYYGTMHRSSSSCQGSDISQGRHVGSSSRRRYGLYNPGRVPLQYSQTQENVPLPESIGQDERGSLSNTMDQRYYSCNGVAEEEETSRNRQLEATSQQNRAGSPSYYTASSIVSNRSNNHAGETSASTSAGIQTRSGRSYATTRTSSNPRMNIQRRILEAERRALNRESFYRQSPSRPSSVASRRARGLSSSSRSVSRSLGAWIEYFRQVNPWLLLSFHEGDFTADDYQMLLQLDERVENKRGASKSVIDSIPCVKVSETHLGESCCICLDEYVMGQSLKQLPCNHVFHQACIEQWLMENACCPIDKERMEGDQWLEIIKNDT